MGAVAGAVVDLTAPGEGHVGGKDRLKQDIGRERQVRHMQHGLCCILDIHHVHQGFTLGQKPVVQSVDEGRAGIADVDLASRDARACAACVLTPDCSEVKQIDQDVTCQAGDKKSKKPSHSLTALLFTELVSQVTGRPEFSLAKWHPK